MSNFQKLYRNYFVNGGKGQAGGNGNQINTTAVGGQAEMEQAMSVPPGASPTDSTGNGGGNIGTGDVPLPGEASFASPDLKPRVGKQTQ